MDKIKRTFGFIMTHPLAKRHIIKSFYRFIVWQIQCNLYPEKLFVKRFVKPVKFYARKGLTGITGNIYAGLHEFYDMTFLIHFLQPDDTFFDVGANVGAYTILASGVCKAKSIAIEPVKATFDILNENIGLNNLHDWVLAINSAAGAEKGAITFTSNEDTTNHAVAKNELIETGIITVPVITIDSLISKNPPAVIKIDVEGFETEVLKGMAATLDLPSLKAIIIELNGSSTRYGYSEEEIHNLLLSKKFKPHTYDPFRRLLTETKTFGNTNTIYCRDIDFINRRLQISKGIHIMGEVI
jgi:FkbM family methyltransferase